MSKLTKKILYSAIALVLVGAAVFFAVFTAGAQGYNYAKKAPKLISGLDFSGFDISSIELTDLTDDLVEEHIASLLLSKADSKISTSGIIGKYDNVALLYRGLYVDADGNYVKADGTASTEPVYFTDLKLFRPGNETKVQASSSNALLEKFGETFKLDGIKLNEYFYNTYTAGFLAPTDTVYLTYKGADGKVVEYEEVVLGEAADAKFGDGFTTALLNHPIGNTIDTLTFGDKTLTGVKVNYAVRTTLKYDQDNNATAGASAVILASINRTSGDSSTVFYVRISGPDYTDVTLYNVTSKALDTTSLDGTFTPGDEGDLDEIIQLLREMEIMGGASNTVGNLSYKVDSEPATDWETKVHYTMSEDKYTKVDKATVTAPANGTDYYVERSIKFTYKHDAVVDASVDAAYQKVALSSLITPMYTFEDDATDKAADGTTELKGKNVKYEIVPTGYYAVKTDIDTLGGLSSFTGDDVTLVKAITTAFKKYNDGAYKTIKAKVPSADSAKFDALINTMLNAKAAPGDTTKAGLYTNAKTEILALTGTDSAPLLTEAQLTQLDTEYTAFLTAVNKYDAALKIVSNDTEIGTDVTDTIKMEKYSSWIEAEYMAVLKDIATESVKESETLTYRTDVAELLWDKIVEASAGKITIPKAAVNKAYHDLMDEQKADFYADVSTTSGTGVSNYKKYNGSFHKYMTAVYTGEKLEGHKDYKALFRAKAEEVARDLIITYWLADQLDVMVPTVKSLKDGDSAESKAMTEYVQGDFMLLYAYSYGMQEIVIHAFVFDHVIDALLDVTYKNAVETYPAE